MSGDSVAEVGRVPGPLRDPSAVVELTFRERIWLHNGDDYSLDIDRVLWQVETFGLTPVITDPRVVAEANRHTEAKNAAAHSHESKTA